MNPNYNYIGFKFDNTNYLLISHMHHTQGTKPDYYTMKIHINTDLSDFKYY